jgi:hypothetical protein
MVEPPMAAIHEVLGQAALQARNNHLIPIIFRREFDWGGLVYSPADGIAWLADFGLSGGS